MAIKGTELEIVVVGHEGGPLIHVGAIWSQRCKEMGWRSMVPTVYERVAISGRSDEWVECVVV